MCSEATFKGISTFFKYPSLEKFINDTQSVGIFGVPFDGGSSYRPGSRFSPADIRRLSVLPRIEQNPIGIQLNEAYSIYDIGDVDVITNSVIKTLCAIEDFVFKIPKSMKTIAVGGDNTISLGVIRALSKRYGKLALIQLDAHSDLDNGLWGEEYFHGSWARLAADEQIIDTSNWIRIGARSLFGKEQRIGYSVDVFDINDVRKRFNNLTDRLGRIHNLPTYISLDLDVLDCGIAPAVGVPVPGGLYSEELFNILSKLSNLNIVGCDIVEYTPTYDRSEQTGILAAYLLQALLVCITNTPNN